MTANQQSYSIRIDPFCSQSPGNFSSRGIRPIEAFQQSGEQIALSTASSSYQVNSLTM